VIGDGRQAVLMDAPPPHEDPRPFISVAEWLVSVGLSAPVILARRPRARPAFARRFRRRSTARERSTHSPDRERDLYELATDVLVHLHGHPPMEGLPVHGLEQWLTELTLFTDWYCPAIGLDVDKDGLPSRLDGGAGAGR
jgi:aminoglycoside/choline kinase family phosphotransferase